MYTVGKIRKTSSLQLANLLLNKLVPDERYEEAQLVKNELEKRRNEALGDPGPWLYIHGSEGPVSILDVDLENVFKAQVYAITLSWDNAIDIMRRFQESERPEKH